MQQLSKMWKLYKIINTESSTVYYGITSRKLNERFNSHKYAANHGYKSYLYAAMRKYGIDKFKIELVKEYNSKEECCLAEQHIIETSQEKLYNLAKGGEVGYSMSNDPRYETWKEKLKEKRQGRKPALGMKHSEENKKFFSECNKRKVPKYPNIDFSLGYMENNKLYGISRTHYYRMRQLFSEQL